MKLNLSYKYLNLIIFLLFVGLVFALFGAISNISYNSADKPIITYIFLFLLLILGTAWFLVTYKNCENSEVLSTATSLVSNASKQTDSYTNKSIDENQEITSNHDVTHLIPANCKTTDEFCETLLRNVAQEFSIVQGLMYLKNENADFYECKAQYAYFSESKPQDFKSGETLPGQAVKNRTIVTLADVPDNYMTIASGLGKSDVTYLVFVPLLINETVVGLIEFATFTQIKFDTPKMLESIADKAAEIIVKINKKVK